MTAAVEVVDVTRKFGEVQALKGITLSIAEGEFFSLLGPSGCGKTTLLRMIAGLDQPTTGQIIIAGKEMSTVPPHKRPVNMVFQSYALFPHMTVFDNVAYGLRIGKRCTEAEIPARVEEALQLVRLPQVAKRYPRELSGGQQQRIAFARAIVNKPLVLLLDEPLSALDPRIREEMQTELARFKRELGITFVMVTHDQSEAFALSDNIAVFDHGMLEQLGTPQSIYEEPKSAFVADFIGRTNVLHGKVVAAAGASITVRVNETLTLTGIAHDGHDFAAGGEAAVWVRTHSVELGAGAGDESTNAIDARIVHRSYQGDGVDFVLDAGGIQLLARRSAASANGHHVGDSVVVKIPRASTHVLPR